MQTKTMQTQSIQSSGGMEKELKSLKPAQPIFIVVGLVLVVFAFCLPFYCRGDAWQLLYDGIIADNGILLCYAGIDGRDGVCRTNLAGPSGFLRIGSLFSCINDGAVRLAVLGRSRIGLSHSGRNGIIPGRDLSSAGHPLSGVSYDRISNHYPACAS